MNDKIDMHLHTDYSDGLLSPKQMVEYCFAKGIDEMAITDHDTIEGIFEAKREAERLGIKFHMGVEISTHMNFEGKFIGLHLLGYDIDVGNTKLNGIFSYLRRCRQKTNERVFELVESDFGIGREEILKSKNTDYIGKPDIGRIMVKKGIFASLEESFEKYFNVGEMARINRKSVNIDEAIDGIVDSGGFAVLAHPAFIKIGERGSAERFSAVESIVKKVKPKGVIGIEAMYLRNEERETEFLCELADREDMIITRGSDYHG